MVNRRASTREDLDEMLYYTVEHNGSDLHLVVGTYPKFRRYGDLQTIPGWDILTTRDTDAMLTQLMDAAARKEFNSRGQWDLSYNIPNKKGGYPQRFRVNLFKQKGAPAGVFRALTDRVPEWGTLGLPIQVFNLHRKKRGLVLFTGPTGSGKSTSMASLIDIINQDKPYHIITLEDPIEYYHWHSKSNISQREIGADCSSFQEGLRAALREDPDVILVGEMRDVETILIALEAAETGHLVFSTLHTIGSVETINRIIDMFPESAHTQIRSQIVSVLEAIVSQQLLPRADKEGRICAYEVLLRNKEIQNYIVNNDMLGMSDYIRSSEAKEFGMVTMDDTLIDYYKKGRISRESALDFSVDRYYVDLNCRPKK